MTLQDELTLSYYQPVTNIGNHRSVNLVVHTETGKIYVKKSLDIFNYDVYSLLKQYPVENTPKIVELVQDEDKLIVIEEYIHGDTLEEVLENGVLTEKQAADYIHQLCLIVKKLHGFNPPVIHRDIKPSNIVITADNTLKLLDMNAAKIATGESRSDTVLIGTAGYAAPEQYGFMESNQQTDIYSIGVMLNVMLTGQLPQNKMYEGALSEVIKKCTQMDRAQRYENVDSLDRAIKLYSDNIKLSLAVPAQQTPTWVDYLPPGFKNNTVIGKFFSAIGYFILINVTMSITTEGVSGPALLAQKLIFTFSVLLAVFFSDNYLGIQERWILTKFCKNPVIKKIAVAITDVLIVFFGLVAMLFTGM